MASIDIELKCNYSFPAELDYEYKCYAVNTTIRVENVKVSSVNGAHQQGRGNEDVNNLDFTNGEVRFLPINMSNAFKNLRKLKANNCGMIGISRSNFNDLIYLKEIDISFNSLSSIPENTFNVLVVLENLELDYNGIKELKAKTFSKLENLKFLWLMENFLEILPDNLFENNYKLELIMLGDNKLYYLQNGLFDNNINLHDIYLDNNNLRRIDSNVFSTMTKTFLQLKLSNNPCINKDFRSVDFISINKELEN